MGFVYQSVEYWFGLLGEMIMKLALNFLCAAIASAFTSTAICAATVDVAALNPSVYGDVNGNNKWYVGVSYTNGTDTRQNIGAGAFRLTGVGENGAASDFLAFCLSPFEWLRLPLQYSVSSDLNDVIKTRLATLVEIAWDQIADSDTAAGFQLAAWEIVSESNDNVLNIADGLFQVTSINSQNAGTYAQSWLDDVQSGDFADNLADITILSADNTQDLLTGDAVAFDTHGLRSAKTTPSPVPLPGTAGLMLLALLALGAAAKARRSF